ncbi:acVLRF1 family peptidyl-tRNA hydrolase, partial [Nocardioides stalactiti]|uniref:acVLRF1 family peptidyl-tRNA hydrolase n=1 Tax=Nocardioides stalactiti TaxID=2755356 RepID=UPI00160337F9
MNRIAVDSARLPRWVENFAARHGETSLAVADGALRGEAADGSWFRARLPFSAPYDGPPTVPDLLAALVLPADWGVLLVRKGGFAVARLAGDEVVASKVGQRHVQGRTKAGGQSQQRFARRRDNQAREAYEAAADHAARILEGLRGPVVVGGDRAAVDAVLTDARLARLVVVEPWLAVPDPRRNVLDAAAREARA